MNELFDQISAIKNAESAGEMTEIFQLIIEWYGFRAFGFIDAPRHGEELPYYITTTEDRWQRTYIDEGFLLVDPCLKKVQRQNSSFAWHEIQSVLIPHGSKSKMVMNAASDNGFQDGLVMPIHYVDTLARPFSALCTLFWKNKAADFKQLWGSRRYELDFIVSFWTHKLIEIVSSERLRLTRHIQGDYDKCFPIVLSGREKDVLAWASHGKTAAETAIVLGISVETVTTHMKNALAKLSATNKVHGVAKAIYLGLIQP